MKAILFASLLLLTPSFAFAATNSVHVDPPVITECGVQDVVASGIASASSSFGTSIRLRLDGTTINTWPSVVSPWTYTAQNVATGTHQFKIELRLFNAITLDTSTRNFTIDECVSEPTPDPEPTPTPTEEVAPRSGGHSGYMSAGYYLGLDQSSDEVREWSAKIMADQSLRELIISLWRYRTFGYY